jgi:hypothetical protein
MDILAGDFDAVVPPRDLAQLHLQLVTPLKTLAAKFSRSAALLAADCSLERQTGEACDESRRKLVGAQAAVTLIGSLGADVQDYSDARDRAVRMLAEHGVHLRPLTTGTTH